MPTSILLLVFFHLQVWCSEEVHGQNDDSTSIEENLEEININDLMSQDPDKFRK